jgi:putative transposase
VLDGGALSLSQIGRIPVRLHRPLAGTPTTVTIRTEADGWYVARSCADVPVEPLPQTGAETGLDVGLTVGLTVGLVTAHGESGQYPRQYRTAAKHLAQAQPRGSRRKPGSQRRRKAVHLRRRTHQQVQRHRRDGHHTTALALLQPYDPISREDLQVRNRVRTHHLAKRLSEASWGQFPTLLAYTAAGAGKRVLAVPPASTTQDGRGVLPAGSRCTPQRVAKRLSGRPHVCPSWGRVRLDRDDNAALNLLRAGQAPQAVPWPGAASVA